MSRDAWLRNDLLRRRRQEAGITLPNPSSSKTSLNQGMILGGGILSIVLLSCLNVIVQTNAIKNAKKSIQENVEKYDEYTNQINLKSILIKSTNEFNVKLAKGISGLRSSSAVLTEISNIIPTSLQLIKVAILDNNITIEGRANSKDGLELVNSFILQLEDSPFFQSDSISLVKASESQNKVQSMTEKVLNFKIQANFSKDISKISSDKLLLLGSEGLASRIEILRKEGLIK